MKLTVQHLHNATTFTCQLQPPGGTIGRGQQNDLDLADPSGELSTLQAIIRLEEGRAAATVLNMSSMGRVAVNDTPLGLSQEATVNNGDSITVGDYQITVDQPQTTSGSADMENAALSATPYDSAAFAGAAAAAGATATGISAMAGAATAATDNADNLPSWHPAYQPPAEKADNGAQADPYPEEHPLGTPINRMPPPTPVPNTTVAPLGGNATPPQTPVSHTDTAQTEDSPAPAAPAPQEDPDDIFKDLLSGPGVLPVGATAADERHPFDMESAINRNHHNPVELLRPQGMQHPSIDGDPLDALPSDGTDKDRYTIFSDDSPTTLSKDTALDSHKEDNILETLRRAAHSGYNDKDKDAGDKS